MTAEELATIFKFQTTADKDYTPTGTLEYVMIDGYDRLTKQHSANDIAGLVPLLEEFVFDAYRDRTPVFIKPEVIIPM
jgi:hypothetical protein